MSAPSRDILIDLSTAILRQTEGALQCRLVDTAETDAKHGQGRLPSGPFMPHLHRTMETGLRQWVSEQVGVDLAHIEQLYTFADQGRHGTDSAVVMQESAHIVSVGYLALSRSLSPETENASSHWGDVYSYFPWEDWRTGRPDMLDAVILPAFDIWLRDNAQESDRARLAFGRDGAQWDEEFVLERYELMYQAGLVEEARRDERKSGMGGTDSLGAALQLDHRRILATALGRLRGKLKYRPVIFDLMPAQFTLRQLQTTTELVMGVNLHTQNFRRLVEKSGFLQTTGQMQQGRGRPAEIFRFRHDEAGERPLAGLRVSSPKGSTQRT